MSQRKRTQTRRAAEAWPRPGTLPKPPATWRERFDSHPYLAFVLAAAAILGLMYARVLGAPFVYDDLDQIVQNPHLSTWHALATRFFAQPVALNTIFRGGGGLTYRPLFWLSLGVDRHLWQLCAAGYHLTSLLLHLANAVLLFAVLRRLNVRNELAAAVGLLWLALPLTVEAVAWISARSYPLATLFLSLGLLAAPRFLDTGSPWTLVTYGLLALASLLSNEIGILASPLLGLLLLYQHTIGSKPHLRRGLALLLTSLAALLGCYILRRRLGVHAALGPTSLPITGSLFWTYIGWLLLPLHMSVERSTSLPSPLLSPLAAFAWVALLVAVAAAFAMRRRASLLSLGVLWLTLCLLPFCGLTFIYQGMAERFVYLASMGLAIAVVAAVASVPRPQRGIAVALASLWMLWGLWRGAQRVANWTDPVTLYTESLQANPRSPILLFNLGYSLKQKGDLPAAENAFTQVLALRPGYPKLHASLGDVYLAENRPADAQRMYAAELAADPQDYATRLNSAVALAAAGDLAAAEQQDLAAIALAPQESGAYTNLGALYVQQNRLAEAMQMFGKAITAKSQDPTPYFDLAVLYQRANQPQQAIPLYEKVLALKPGDPDTLANLSALR